MKLFRSILLKLGLDTHRSDPTPNTLAADTPSMPEAEAGQYFRLGEIYKQTTAWTCLQANDVRPSEPIGKLREQACGMQLPAEIIGDIDRYENTVSGLPWNQPWADWNDADQQVWNAAKPYSTHWNDWLMVQPRDRYFFYMLGRLSMKGWSEVEDFFNEGRETAASLTPVARDLLGAFGMLYADAFFIHARTTLNPMVLRALQDLIALKNQVEALPAGVEGMPEVILQLGAACRVLRDENRAGKLTRN